MVATPADRALANRYTEEYAYQVWWLVAPFLFLVGVTHYGSVALRKLFPGRQERTDVEVDGRMIRDAGSFRRLPLAIANAYRVLAFRTTFTVGPFSLNLAEVALTIAYIVALFVWSFINTTSLSGGKFELVYYINRTANIACGQLPLVVTLGTKNNIVGLITGLSHEKINYMHRMTARVVSVLLWVHASSRVWSLHIKYIQAGVLAISALSFLLITSLRPVRKAAYEVFFFLHFVMVLCVCAFSVFLVGGYLHTNVPRVAYWFWVSFLIWGLDRLIRFIRLIAFNHSYFGFKKGSTMDADVELLSPHFVRLRLRRPPHFHWSPGQTAYLIMPGVSTIPFEAHPFTIASVDTTRDEPLGEAIPTTEKEALAETEPYWKELVFFINVHGGFTRRLADIAEKGGNVKVFIDGPYGKSPDLTGYDTSVLIAGGSGVSFTLPLLLDGIKKAAAGNSNTKRIVFIWSIRDPRHILWISETLGAATKLAPQGLAISIQIYLTGDSAFQQWDDVSIKSGKENDETQEKSRSPSLLEDPAVQITRGSRPNLKQMLQEEADFTEGRMGVTVCGSQSVAAAVKDALGFSIAGPSKIMKGGPSITLYTEAFGYA
ncbi:hypothetical protein BDM02DRAFT_3086890 [Thelephora ganbajun]|uniref:Uncharacterized protein n=1 Tax=Thelephora ganbajun TaxID=370292 RepID=A0ACB6ZVQ4_THEGA|nr:hypothetical protein BDM02DRAFT_3086890 [Thelephora ganbajun]